MMKKIVTTLLLATITLFSDSISLILDNDTVLDSDDAYTGGLNLTWMSSSSKNSSDFGQWYTNNLSSLGKTFIDFDGKYINSSISYQGIAITPENKKRTTPNYNDYAYASASNFNTALHIWNKDIYESFSFGLGVMGESSGVEEFQSSFHELIGSHEAKGWDFQLKDRLNIEFGYEKGFRSWEKNYKNGMKLEWFNSYFANLGSIYSGAGFSSVLRYGHNVPKNFETMGSTFSTTSSHLLKTSKQKNLGWALSLGFALNGVGYFYYFEEARKQGYKFDKPNLLIVARGALHLYIKNWQLAFELFPMGSLANDVQKDGWGRLLISKSF